MYLTSPKTPLEVPVYSFIAVLIGIFSEEGSRSRVFYLVTLEMGYIPKTVNSNYPVHFK